MKFLFKINLISTGHLDQWVVSAKNQFKYSQNIHHFCNDKKILTEYKNIEIFIVK